MLQGITRNGEMKNVVVNDDGTLPVNLQDSGENGIKVEQTSDKEVTLKSDILTLGTTSTSITIGKKVTSIMIANYSDEADVSIVANNQTYKAGANLAIEFPINANIDSFTLVSTVADTKVQLIVKGVE